MRYLLPRTKRESSYTNRCCLGDEICQTSTDGEDAGQSGTGFPLQTWERKHMPCLRLSLFTSLSSADRARSFPNCLGRGIFDHGSLAVNTE